MAKAGKVADIGTSLFGKGRRDVLGLLFTRPEPMYLREIIAAVDGGQGQVQRALEKLHKAGLVRREKRANLVYYSPNPDAPIYEELRGIALKTFGLAEELRSLLRPLAPRIAVAFIYGSVARREERASSDVDVMVIGDAKFADAVLALRSAEDRLRRSVNPSVYSKREFQARLREKGGFLQRVLGEPKIFLIGTARDLEQLAGHRASQGA